MLKKTEERQVIKIGSNSIIEYGEKGIMRTRIALLNMIASYVNTSQKYGTKTAIVSSGAVACGRMICAERSINHDEVGKQVLASIGNVELNRLWQIAFSYHNITTAQILLNSTGDNGNYQEHIAELFSLGIVPIINENDIVTTNDQSRDIIFRDNDTMAANVGRRIGANRLEIVSAEINGYIANYGTDNANIVEEMNLGEIKEAISREEGNATRTTFGTGVLEQSLKLSKFS